MSTPHDELAAQTAEVRASARRAVREAVRLLADVQRCRAEAAGARHLVDLRDVSLAEAPNPG
jgi:hypothetical protein